VGFYRKDFHALTIMRCPVAAGQDVQEVEFYVALSRCKSSLSLVDVIPVKTGNPASRAGFIETIEKTLCAK